MQAVIARMFKASAEIKLRFADENGPRIETVARRMADTIRKGRSIFFCGNGGSAADAQHLAAEFVNRFMVERRALPGLALTTDTSALTSIGNDRGFEEIFARQLEALGRPGDMLVGITTSGQSSNVVRALRTARQIGCYTVVFTGGSGGAVVALADEAFIVPSQETPRVQETHITLGHALCGVVDLLLQQDRAQTPMDPANSSLRGAR